MQVEKHLGDVNLVPYTLECLDKSWVWLNDPEIRELTMTSHFTKEAQREFFDSLPTRIGYKVWGVSLEGYGVIGAAGLKDHRGTMAEYWGYIGERQFWGQGLGRKLIAAVERESRKLGFSALDLKVSASNVRAIALYIKAGFVMDHHKSDEFVVRMVKQDI